MNPFLLVAETQVAAPVRRRHKAAKTRAEKRIARKQEETSTCLTLWRKVHQETIAEALDSPEARFSTAILASMATARAREHCGKPPFDDALPERL